MSTVATHRRPGAGGDDAREREGEIWAKLFLTIRGVELVFT